MNYENTHNKINDIYIRENKNTNNIILEQNNNDNIKKLVKVNVTYRFNKFWEYDTDWVNLVADTDESSLIKEWNITINKIPNDLIPFIRFNGVYKTVHTTINDDFKISNIFRVVQENINGTEFSKVELIIGMYLTYTGVIVPQVQGKILLSMFNPGVYF